MNSVSELIEKSSTIKTSFSGPSVPLCTSSAELLPETAHFVESKPVLSPGWQQQQLTTADDPNEQLLIHFTTEDDHQQTQQSTAEDWRRQPQLFDSIDEDLEQQQLTAVVDWPKSEPQASDNLGQRLEQALQQLGQLQQERNSLEQRLEQLTELEQERNSLEQRLEQALEDKCELEELENDSRLREAAFSMSSVDSTCISTSFILLFKILPRHPPPPAPAPLPPM